MPLLVYDARESGIVCHAQIVLGSLSELTFLRQCFIAGNDDIIANNLLSTCSTRIYIYIYVSTAYIYMYATMATGASL